MTTPIKTPEEFLLAVICPLEVEALAMIRQLDEDKDYGEEFSKDCNFTLGGIGEHNIVITSLPAGRQGNTSAAIAAQQTMAKFPRITYILLVGIAGGVPSDKNDIRLGDVVISSPHGKYGGVVQYDFGKDKEQFEHNGQTNSVPPQLLAYLTALKLRHGRNRSTKPKYLEYLEAQMTELEKPDSSSDRLFPASYNHQGGSDCTACDEKQAQRREAREGPRVHCGLIASGNRVMENAEQRDKYNQDHGGIVLAYEMEAAGLMNFTPCLVIRGISDYADSHKPPGEGWHAYAAAVAAAYAREFIEKVPVETLVKAATAQAEPEPDIQLLNPSISADREILYRLFLTSLPREPVSRDDSHAMQGYLFSELMLWKNHAQGPWNYWLRNYLANGLPVNIRDFRGKTPLHHALMTKYEREDKVRALVGAGADITMRDFEEQTPVDLAKGVGEGLFIFLLRTWQRSVATSEPLLPPPPHEPAKIPTMDQKPVNVWHRHPGGAPLGGHMRWH